MSKAPSTRDHLLNIAGHLFAERGFDGVSVRDIARAAKVNLGAVNYHFKTKEELYMSVFREKIGGVHATFEPFEKNFDAPPSEVIPEFVETFMRYVLIKNQHLVPLVLRELAARHAKRLSVLANDLFGPNFKILLSYLQHQMDLGRLRRCDPMKCAINLISLCLYPAHMKPIMIRLANFDPSKPDSALSMAKHNTEIFLRAFETGRES